MESGVEELSLENDDWMWIARRKSNTSENVNKKQSENGKMDVRSI